MFAQGLYDVSAGHRLDIGHEGQYARILMRCQEALRASCVSPGHSPSCISMHGYSDRRPVSRAHCSTSGHDHSNTRSRRNTGLGKSGYRRRHEWTVLGCARSSLSAMSAASTRSAGSIPRCPATP